MEDDDDEGWLSLHLVMISNHKFNDKHRKKPKKRRRGKNATKLTLMSNY